MQLGIFRLLRKGCSVNRQRLVIALQILQGLGAMHRQARLSRIERHGAIVIVHRLLILALAAQGQTQIGMQGGFEAIRRSHRQSFTQRLFGFERALGVDQDAAQGQPGGNMIRYAEQQLPEGLLGGGQLPHAMAGIAQLKAGVGKIGIQGKHGLIGLRGLGIASQTRHRLAITEGGLGLRWRHGAGPRETLRTFRETALPQPRNADQIMQLRIRAAIRQSE